MKAPVVVFDAATGIGRGVVQAALAQDRPVIAVSMDQGELRQLSKRHPHANLTLLSGSITNELHSASLAAKLRQLDRPIAGFVITNCGDLVRGRVLDQPADSLHRRLELDLLPQLAAARQLVPVLSEAGRNGGYVVIGSPGSEQPWAGYGYRSIAAAAVNMLIRVLHDEARSLGVRVQMLTITRPARTEDNDDCACDGWPAAIDIGQQALALIDQTDSRQARNAVVPFSNSAIPASEPEAETEDQINFDQAKSLLEPIFTSNRNEAIKS